MSAHAPRVVLVEDEEPVRQAVERALQRGGIAVTAFADDPGPGPVLAAGPDLAVLDVMLPGGDGFELARALRAARDIPIVFLTARDTVDDRLGASSSAPTTTWSNRSHSKSCSHACAPCSVEPVVSGRRSKPATTSTTNRPGSPAEPGSRSD